MQHSAIYYFNDDAQQKSQQLTYVGIMFYGISISWASS